MSNKPVAWIDEINTFVLDKDYKQFPKSLQNGMIPLYTHPAKTLTETEDTECQYCKQGCIRCDARKLLTDEEILQANLEFGKENGEDYSMLTIEDIEPLIGLVKFILRKASEK